MLDTIKSYLVSLGFSVDKNTYDQATKAMGNVETGVTRMAGSAVTKFAIAGAAVTSFVGASVFGLAKFIGSLGDASIENEKLARQMWTTEKNAMSLNSTLRALDVSLQDLYLSPTLMSQFQQLRAETEKMQAPADYKDQMRTVQSISFEFKRLKLEATYALQWVGYYFIKYLAGPLGDTKRSLKDINDAIVKTMPNWTKRIAQVLSWFAQMGVTTVRAFKDITRVFDELGQGIPKNLKLVAGAAAAIGVIIATGPIGIITAILLGAILLLDDFYGYLDGKDAAFGPFWQKLIDFKDELEMSGKLQELKDNFFGVFDAASNVLDAIGDVAAALFDLDDTQDGLLKLAEIFRVTINGALNVTKETLQTIADLLNAISSTFKGELGDYLKEQGKQAEERLQSNPEFQDQGKKGFWDFKGAWNFLNHMSSDVFTGDSFSKDQFSLFFGRMSELFSPKKSTDYIYPQANTTNNNSKVTLQQTNNIYGSDPNATAGAAQDNWFSFYTRTLRGGIR